MIHFKDNCSASDQILANDCGLACANCLTCKCSEDRRPIEKLETLEQLVTRARVAWHDSNSFHERMNAVGREHGSPVVTGYSYPAHQLKAIEKRAKELGVLDDYKKVKTNA